jgi:hypothetical protein
MLKNMMLTALFLVGFSIPAVAQNSIENLYCSDYHGNRVQIIPDSSARLIAEAGISTYGVPQIRINPMQLKDLSPNARIFAIGHVCANLTLGHLVRAVENIYDHYDRVGNADCSAAAKLFYSGQVNKKGIDAIEEEINKMSREQWSHFPGPVRVVVLNEVCELKPMN